MLTFGNELIGKRVRVTDSITNELVADTKITGCDSGKNLLKLSASGVFYHGERHVSLAIGVDKGVYEFVGILRRPMIANEVEVAIYQGSKKESRRNERFAIKARGCVEGIFIQNQKIMLQKPIGFVTDNISVNGVLIRTMAGSLAVNDRVQIFIDLEKGTIRNIYEVCRVIHENIWTEEYGCRLIGEEEGKYDE